MSRPDDERNTMSKSNWKIAIFLSDSEPTTKVEYWQSPESRCVLLATQKPSSCSSWSFTTRNTICDYTGTNKRGYTG